MVLYASTMPDAYTITITRSMRRTLSLHILPDASLEIKAPFFVSKSQIDTFIEDHKLWIDKRRNVLKQKVAAQKTYTHGETFLYLGKEYALEIGNYTSIKIHGEKLLFPKALSFRAKKEMETWYIAQAKEIITAQTEKFAKEMHTSYKKIVFSDTKSQWGSCTRDNRLQFSWRLIMTPLLVLNYVVIHELAHTIEKNHSFLFWSKVRAVNPSYKQQIKWLKQHGNTLVA